MLIVLEGLDGSGKATQTKLLFEALQKKGQAVRAISFPNYQSPASSLIRMYLAGELGTLETVNPYAASSFYALDRYASFVQDWKADYDAGALILADRYATSNLCHQMSRLPPAQWEGYLQWLTDYEYRLLGLPAPDGVIFLDMPPAASQRLLSQRYGGDERQKDLHEANLSYLAGCHRAARFAAQRLGWKTIACAGPDDDPFPPDQIAKAVWQAADAILHPEATPHNPHQTS